MSFALLGSCGGGGGGGTAQPLTLENLYCFGSSSTDALGPDGALVQVSDGSFYGTTSGGGIGGGPANVRGLYPGNGTVFKITPMGEETVVHLFGAVSGDGVNPHTLIQGSDGNLYGTTALGGANNSGTVFKLTTEGVETILYSFTGDPDGAVPVALVEGSDGNFYGTTVVGGASNNGTFFNVTPEGVETVLRSFGSSSFGDEPEGQLIQASDGNFYGTTNYDTGSGLFFKITPDGVETILQSLSNPVALIQGSDGNFYGTTGQGGPSNAGTAFKLTPEGIETILHFFTGGNDGAGPSLGLVQGSDGNFYGTTHSAGGTIFELTPKGVFTGLYTFPESGAGFPSSQLAQGNDGNLYGTTFSGGGGAIQAGCFFRFVLTTH